MRSLRITLLVAIASLVGSSLGALVWGNYVVWGS